MSVLETGLAGLALPALGLVASCILSPRPSPSVPGELTVRELHGVRRVAETLLLGPLCIALLLLLCSLVGLRWNVWALAVPPVVAAFLLLLRGAGSGISIPLLGGCVAAVLVVGFASLQAPLYISDPVNIYAPAAVVYAEAGRVDPALLGRVAEPAHLDYPPLYTLNLAWLFFADGGYNGWLAKPLGACFLVGLFLELLLLARAQGLGRRVGVAAALSFSAVPLAFKEATSGFADLALTAYLAACLAALVRVRPGDRGALARAVVFGGAAALTKNEGLVLALLLGGVFLLPGLFRRGGCGLVLGAALGFALIVLPWNVWVRSAGFENDLVSGVGSVTPVEALQRVPTVAKFLATESLAGMRTGPMPRTDDLRVPAFGVAYLAFAAALLVQLARLLRGGRGPQAVLLIAPLQLLLYALVFAFTPRDLEWHLDTASSRLLLQALPALMAFVVATLPARSAD